jgi:hypothetical protein
MQQFLDRFIKSYNNHKPSEINPTLVLAFFNCLLNGYITSFNLTGGEAEYHPFWEVIDLMQLLQIISQRCTNLQALSLSFGVSERIAVPSLPTLYDTLRGLTGLKELSISWKTTADTDFLPFFATLGDTCPNLTTLELGCGIPFDVEHLLALVLGRKYQLVPMQLIIQLKTFDSSVANLQFSALSLSPIEPSAAES